MSTTFGDAGVDLRVRRTRRLLWEALVAELADRPLEAITVRDICERAMVHRTTFYKHFQDKYALLDEGIRRMLVALAPEAAHLPPSAYSVEEPPPYFVRLFEQAAQNPGLYRLMAPGDGVGQFQSLLTRTIAEGAAASMAKTGSVRGEESARSLAMHARFIGGGVVSLLAWWLENDMPLSPREMAQFVMSPHP